MKFVEFRGYIACTRLSESWLISKLITSDNRSRLEVVRSFSSGTRRRTSSLRW